MPRFRTLVTSPHFGLTVSYAIIAGILPAIAVWQLKNGGSFFFAYAHLFIYPICFGPFVVWLLVNPTKYLFEVNPGSRIRWTVLGPAAAIALIITVADGTSGNHALWELSDSASDQTLHDHFMNPSTEKKEKKLYAETINKQVGHIQNWSLARYFYLISMLVQTFVLFTFFSVLGHIALHTPEDLERTPKKRSSIVRLALGYLSCLIWLGLRLIFLYTEKYRLYDSGSETFLPGNLFIYCLFALALVYIILALFVAYGKIVEAAITTVFGVGPIVVAIFGIFHTESLPKLREIDPFNYAFAIAMIVIIAIPYLHRNND